jgi:tripartite-type tricarboxylate transporter receptor subunit TctC
MNFSSVGVGSATHLSAERFLVSAGVQAVHIPFKGGAEALAEVIAGRIDFFFGPVGLVLPHVKGDKLSALAVNTASRSTALPDVPTLREAGFSDADYPFWIGMFVPAKTARVIVEKLHHETLRALEEPKVRDKLVALGVQSFTMSPSEFDAYIARAIDADAMLVKATGLKATK